MYLISVICFSAALKISFQITENQFSQEQDLLCYMQEVSLSGI